MFGLFGNSFLGNQIAQMKARRLTACVPWTDSIKWEKELNIQASTYAVRDLFAGLPGVPVLRERGGNPNHYPEPGVASPDGRWLYCVKELPAGGLLNTWSGSRIGTVMFDGPVLIPCIHEQRHGQWDQDPWMSLTPAELISMRGGIRIAKGKVVVAGLGLGHLLIEVSKRPQVKELILVEKSQALCDWLMPRVKAFLGREVQVIVGDAKEVMPTLQADVGLVDIYPMYGNNDSNHRFSRTCPNIGTIWIWGAAKVR